MRRRLLILSLSTMALSLASCTINNKGEFELTWVFWVVLLILVIIVLTSALSINHDKEKADDAGISLEEYYEKERKNQEWREKFAGVEVEYLGGYPEWSTPGKVNLSVYEAKIILQRGSEKFRISKDMIVSMSNERSYSRNVGKAAAGAIIGGMLSGRNGFIAGGALGARQKDTSEVFITYIYNGVELTLNLRPGKNTDKVYSWINSIFA